MKQITIFPIDESDWDIEDIHECIKQNKYYYKIIFPNFPIIDLDIEELSKWSKENNYVTHATEEEKTYILWDGTKKHLIDKKVWLRSLLQRRLIKWCMSKKQKDSNTMLLTEKSPIIPHRSLFYKKIEEKLDKIEWTFPSEITSCNIYTYQHIFKPGYITESIGSELSNDHNIVDYIFLFLFLLKNIMYVLYVDNVSEWLRR